MRMHLGSIKLHSLFLSFFIDKGLSGIFYCTSLSSFIIEWWPWKELDACSKSWNGNGNGALKWAKWIKDTKVDSHKCHRRHLGHQGNQNRHQPLLVKKKPIKFGHVYFKSEKPARHSKVVSWFMLSSHPAVKVFGEARWRLNIIKATEKWTGDSVKWCLKIGYKLKFKIYYSEFIKNLSD